jgi:hypothetical protein
MTTPSHDPAVEAITSDAPDKDGSGRGTAPATSGPRDLVEPDELTVAAADGDSGPRKEQKAAGGM